MKLINELINARPKNSVTIATVKNVKEKMKRVMKHDVYIAEYRNQMNTKKAAIYFIPSEQAFKVSLETAPKNDRLPMSTPWKKTEFKEANLEDVIDKINEFLNN